MPPSPPPPPYLLPPLSLCPLPPQELLRKRIDAQLVDEAIAAFFGRIGLRGGDITEAHRQQEDDAARDSEQAEASGSSGRDEAHMRQRSEGSPSGESDDEDGRSREQGGCLGDQGEAGVWRTWEHAYYPPSCRLARPTCCCFVYLAVAADFGRLHAPHACRSGRVATGDCEAAGQQHARGAQQGC